MSSRSSEFDLGFVWLLAASLWADPCKGRFPGWYGVAVVIPMANVLLVVFLAFAEWPLERKLSGSRPSSDEVWLAA